MSLPASTTLYVRWTNGQPLSGTTYTHAGADVPGSHTWTAQNGATLGTDADSPWNGQYLAELDGNNRMDSTVSSSTVPTTTGRFYIEAEGGPNANGDLIRFEPTTANNGRVRVKKTGGGNMLVNITMNGGAEVAEVDLGTYPTGAYAVEVIYDTTNGTAANRLQARTYAVGGSPPSMTTITGGSISSAATDQYVILYVGDNTGWDNSLLKVNRVLFVSDTTEDLSAVTETSVSVYAFQ